MSANRTDITPKQAAAQLRKLSPAAPALGIVLGTGFHHAINGLEIKKRVSYSSISGFPPTTVSGHAGELIWGRLGGTPVIVLNGRAHYYEGHSLERVTFAVRTLAAYGVRDLLLTNASGGINRAFRVGDFMVLTDHINFMGVNPLRGVATPGLPRFVDLTQVYDNGLSRLLLSAGSAIGLPLRRGVYLAVSGPTYETPAEVRVYGQLGADAVGMSTVPEAVVARQYGMRVAGVSCITNRAAGLGKTPLSHAEVLATAEKVKVRAAGLLEQFAGLYGEQQRSKSKNQQQKRLVRRGKRLYGWAGGN